MKTRYSNIPAYITKDGSEIRVGLHPGQLGVRHQSLEEAIVYPGKHSLVGLVWCVPLRITLGAWHSRMASAS